MKCNRCGKSVFDEILIRINPKGEVGIFWCETCVKAEEPELYKNEMIDDGPLMMDLKKIIYNK